MIAQAHQKGRQARSARFERRLAGAISTVEGDSFGDVLGGRILAWLGGAATLLGIILFLALAISHGWIGEQARVLLAAAASAALMAAGVWLHDHRGRTDAAIMIVGTASAGLFASLFVASDVYGLLPGSLAVGAALLVGAITTGLASRWGGRAGWLLPGAVLMCVPQWAGWVLGNRSVVLDMLVLAGFAGLGVVGAVAVQLRCTEERLVPCSTAALVLSACVAAVVGRLALGFAAGPTAGDLWLAGLAGAHLGCAVWRTRRVRISLPLRRLLIAIGVALADAALGLSAHGVTLALGWSGTAVAFAWLGRRTVQQRSGENVSESSSQSSGETLLGFGVSAQIALALIGVLFEAPPSALGTGDAQLLPLLSVSVLAASCIACGRLGTAERTTWRVLLDSLGLVAIAYLTASALGGAALVATWAFEGLALARLSSRSDDALTRVGAIAFVSGAALHVLALEAPPVALATGVADLGAATLALGALAAVGLRVGLAQPGTGRRYWPLIGAGACVLYLASVAIVTAFQPTSTAVSDVVLDLSVRQQGQVALSALWSVVGLAALIAGLRANIVQLRTAGLALLLMAVGKVFLYDLSTLTSVYRVASFIVLGLLLLAGAFAYQRLRPPPLPDMRTLHPSQR